MNHNRTKSLLSAYADRQTGPLRRFLLGRHIATCPSCLAELEALQTLRTTLRTTLSVHRAPPALAMRIGSALPRHAPPSPRRYRPRFRLVGTAMAGGLAGILLTLTLSMTLTRLSAPPDPMIADVVADHVRSLMADHLTDVATSDRHTVKPWLSARLDLSPRVEDFAAQGFPLVGGRLDYVQGHRAAAIVYRRDKHIINLFVLVSEHHADAPSKQESHNGFNIIRWRMDGLSYIAVSDVEATQLQAFVRLVESG
jgi:anti-sigma factor RsiW